MAQQFIETSSRRQVVSSRDFIAYGAFFGFFLFGVVGNMKGVLLPIIIKDLHLTYTQGGTLLFAEATGFFLATLLVGPLSDIIGKRALVFISCGCFVVGILGFSGGHLFGVLLAAMLMMGLALGALEVGGNLIIVDLYPKKKGRYLNLLNFFYGIGSMLIPFYAGFLLSWNISWRNLYRSGLMLVVILFVYFLFIVYPRKTASAASQTFDWKAIGKSAFTGDMPIFYFAMTTYVAAELGTAAWLVEFLQSAKSFSILRSSLFLSLFFGAMTAGRFLGSFLVERLGYLKSMLYASFAAILSIMIGTFGPSGSTFFLPLSGFFYAIIFPTLTAVVSERHQQNLGTILGLLFTFAGLGGMLGPWMIGAVSDRFNIQTGFGIITLFCIGFCATLSLLVKNETRTHLHAK